MLLQLRNGIHYTKLQVDHCYKLTSIIISFKISPRILCSINDQYFFRLSMAKGAPLLKALSSETS